MRDRSHLHGARPAEPELRAALSRLIERDGLRRVAATLDVNERTLARVASGADVHVATAELLAIRYLELPRQPSSSSAPRRHLRLVREKTQDLQTAAEAAIRAHGGSPGAAARGLGLKASAADLLSASIGEAISPEARAELERRLLGGTP